MSHRRIPHLLLALLLLLTTLPALTSLSPIPAAAQTSATLFTDLRTLPGTWSTTKSVALGDLNGDGFLDLVLGNYHNLSQIFLNDGRGGFAAPTDIAGIEKATTSIALGDLNGDGFLDLVIGNNGAFSQVFLNDGTGDFGAPSDITGSGKATTSIALGDLNGDGFLDLVIGNNGAFSQVFLNDGTGGFGTPSDITSTGQATTSIALGDLNGDGFLDLVLGNDGTLSQVVFNDGKGGFGIPNDITGSGKTTSSVAVGDLNSDGFLDLVLGNKGVFSQVFLNDGKGGLGAPSDITGSGKTTASVALGDLNGDGFLDLVLGNTVLVVGDTRNSILSQAFLNDGKGGFGAPSTITGSGKNTASVVLGDFNGDGFLDLVLGNNGEISQVVFNDGRSRFLASSDITGSGRKTRSVALGDLNGDGFLDLVLSNDSIASQIVLNDGHGGLGTPSDITGSGKAPSKMALGDLNGDGAIDLVLANFGIASQIFLNLNNGTGTFAAPSDITGSGNISTDVALGDLNGDGALDLVLGNNSVPSQVFLNNGTGTFAAPSDIIGSRNATMSLAIGDLNGDGALDLVLGNNGFPSQIALNNGQGGFNPLSEISDSGRDTYSVALGDLNSDGFLDLIMGNYYGDSSQVALNNGKGGFDSPSDIPGSGQNTNSVALGDLDGDGSLDLVLGNDGFASQVAINNGYGGFTLSSNIPNSGKATTSAALGDLNGDGTLDVVLGNDVVASQVVLQHNGFAKQAVDTPPAISVGLPGSTPAAHFYASAKILSTPTISVPFTLTDAEGDPVREVQVHYSPDGGGRWFPAIAATGTITRNLTTSPSGVAHTFVWDTGASGFYGQSDDVVLRMRAIASVKPQAKRRAGSYPAAASTWASSLPFRLRGTIARVVDTNAKPVSAALVYHVPSGQSRDGPPLPNWITRAPLPSLASGYVASREPITPGDQLVAVQTMTSTDRLSFAYTSAAPNSVGLDALTVGAGGGTQTLTVSPNNPLLLLNLSVGLEWDARSDTTFMSSLRARLRRSSEILYDWTNGQVALGTLTIYQNKEHWDHTFDAKGTVITRGVDLRIYASNQIRPNATQGGIVNSPTTISYPGAPGGARTASYEPGYIRMGASWNAIGNPGADVAEDWAKALAHEVGHYALFLDETYLGKQGSLLVPVTGCESAMSDPYTDSASEFRPTSDWPTACQTTLQYLGTGLSEWAMITTFYNRIAATNGFTFTLNVPALATSNPGPVVLPLGVTVINDATAADTAINASDTYTVIPPSGGRYNASPGARTLIFPAENQLPIDLGTPSAGQVIARGYRDGDRLCVFDIAKSLLGCTLSPTGLHLSSAPGWSPDLQITPITYPGASGTPTMTLRIVIQASTVSSTTLPSALQFQIYPREGTTVPVSATLPLADGFYRADVALPRVLEEGLVRVWIPNDSLGRETISDYAVGGNPSPRYMPPARDRRDAPAVSPDGQATLFAEDTSFATGQFFALQRASSLPTLPPWATAVGQGYRLLASDPTMLSNLNNPISLSMSYAQSDVPTGMESDVRVLFHNGTRWQELPTRVDMDRNEAAVTVQAAPGLYVLITSLRLNFSRSGWSLLYAYPGASQDLPLALQSAHDQAAYDIVYGYSATDSADPWKVFSPQMPSWANDLTRLVEGASYWLHLTKATSVALPIPGLSAQDFLPAPPSTVYGTLDASWGFTPTVGLSVQALVDTAVCGSTTTKDIGDGKIGFVLDILARDGNRPTCGSNGTTTTLRILNGSSTLKDVTLSWQNDQIRAIGPNGVLLLNHIYLPLIQFPG